MTKPDLFLSYYTFALMASYLLNSHWVSLVSSLVLRSPSSLEILVFSGMTLDYELHHFSIFVAFFEQYLICRDIKPKQCHAYHPDPIASPTRDQNYQMTQW